MGSTLFSRQSSSIAPMRAFNLFNLLNFPQRTEGLKEQERERNRNTFFLSSGLSESLSLFFFFFPKQSAFPWLMFLYGCLHLYLLMRCIQSFLSLPLCAPFGFCWLIIGDMRTNRANSPQALTEAHIQGLNLMRIRSRMKFCLLKCSNFLLKQCFHFTKWCYDFDARKFVAHCLYSLAATCSF